MRFHEGLLQYSNSLETRCQFRWRQRSLLPCQSQLCPKSMWHFHGYAAMEWYYGAIWTIMDLHRGIRYNEASLVLMGHSDWTILDLSEHVWQLPDCHQEDVQLALRVVYAPMEDWLDLAVSMGPNLSHWWKGCISRVSKNGPLPQRCSWHPCSNSANALALRSGGFDCWHQEGMHVRISSYIIVSYTIVYHRIPISHHSLSTRMYQGRFSRSLALTASATELEVQGWDPLTWRQASDIGHRTVWNSFDDAATLSIYTWGFEERVARQQVTGQTSQLWPSLSESRFGRQQKQSVNCQLHLLCQLHIHTSNLH